MDAKPVLNAYTTQLTSNPAFFNDRAEMQDPLKEDHLILPPNLTSGENYGDGVAAAAP